MSTAGETTMSATGEATVPTAGVTTAGVTAVSTAGVTTTAAGVTAAGVTFLSLVVLRHLDSLLDVFKFDAYNSVVRHSVHWSGGSVVRRDSVGSMAGRRTVSFVLDLILQDDVPDLLQQMRVYIVAF